MPGKQSTACSVRRGGIMLDEELCQAQTEFMKLPALLIWSAFLASSPIAPAAETQTPDPGLYGPYPANYKEIVTDWLQTQLIDPSSARIEWKGEPKPADLGKKGEHLYGYLVSFTVNATGTTPFSYQWRTNGVPISGLSNPTALTNMLVLTNVRPADSAQFSACVTELGDPQYIGTALTIQTCLGFLLTTISIELIPRFVSLVGWRYAFMILAPGPLFGVISMLRLRGLPEALKIAQGRR